MFILWTINCIGGIVGGIILFIIMYQTRNNSLLYGYTQGLLQNSILDFIYAFICLFVQPEVTVINGVFISSTNLFNYSLPSLLSNIMSVLFPIIFITISMISFLPFYVRYLTLCSCTKQSSKIFKAYSVFIFIAISYNIYLAFIFCYNPEENLVCKIYKATASSKEYKWFNYICIEPKNIYFVLGMIFAVIMVTANYFLIIFFNYKVLKFLKFEIMIPEMKNSFRQLQTCMILQCISSATAIVFPLSVNAAAYMFNEFSNAEITTYMSLLHSFVAITNPVLTICAVKQYRLQLWEWIQNFCDLILT